LKDLGKGFLAELEDFFVNYHQLSGKKYRVIDAKGPNEAAKRTENAMREFRKR
jgi:inorganic pyrophosphatase